MVKKKWYTFAIDLHLDLRAFSRCFNPKQFTIRGHLSEARETKIYRCWYSKDVHRTKCQALAIVRITTKIARIRC